jgi:hypothetical protein
MHNAPIFSGRNAGWSSPVARQAHNLKVAGSNPAPATNFNPASAGFFMPDAKIFYQVYVLRNPAGRFYIGLSSPLPPKQLQRFFYSLQFQARFDARSHPVA